MTRCIGSAIVLASISLSSAALADSPVTYALEYTGAAQCPNEQAFVEAIQVRAPLASRTDAPAAHVVFEAHISEESGVSRGFLLVRVAGGETTRRDVPDASCSEIVASMAVIAALVVEGLAKSSSAPSAVEAPGESAPAPPPAAPTKPPAVKKSPIAVVVPPARASPAVPPDRAQQTRSGEPTGLRAGLAAAAGIESAVAPTLGPVFAAGIDVSTRLSAVLSPSARLSGLYARTGPHSTVDGSARFQWLIARLALCPVRFKKDNFALRPCLELDAGELEGRGESTQAPRTQSLFWLGAGSALHGEFELGQILALEVQLGGRVLARPARFLFLPDTEAHYVPRFSFNTTLGLIARLP